MAAIGKGLESYLHRQATELALNHLAEAREQATKIQEQAQNELLKVQNLYEQQSEHSTNQERRRSLAKAKLASNHQLTENIDLVIQDVWKQAEAALRSIGKADSFTRRSILKDLIVDAATQLQGGSLVFQVSCDDSDLATSQFVETLFASLAKSHNVTGLVINPKVGSFWGGVVVTQAESTLMVDNSLDNRLSLAKKELRNQVYQILDSESSAEHPTSE